MKSIVSSTQEKARSLMVNQHHALRNRQQAMLARSAAEVGVVPKDLK